MTKNEKCDRCSETFFYHRALRRHSLSVHKIKIPKRVKIVKCKLCYRALRGSGNLKAHLKTIHTTEIKAMENDLKKYDMTEHCQNCGNNFLNKKVLQGHNRAFVTEHRRKVLNKEETVECIQGYMLEILSVGCAILDIKLLQTSDHMFSARTNPLLKKLQP